MVRVFTNGPRDRGSIVGRVIPKTKKWYLMLPCISPSIILYKAWVSGSTGKAPTPRCCSY